MKRCRIWGSQPCFYPFQCCRQSKLAWTAWRWAGAFAAMFFQDVCWAFYVASVGTNAAIVASCWAALLFLLGAGLVLGYTRDRTLLIPAAIGAWAGTYLGVIFT